MFAKLKSHLERETERQNDIKAKSLEKLTVEGVLHFGWSILPRIADAELKLIDYRSITYHMEEAENAEDPVAEFTKRITSRIENEKRQYCDHMRVGNSSSALSNVFTNMELEHKPERWKSMESFIWLAQQPD